MIPDSDAGFFVGKMEKMEIGDQSENSRNEPDFRWAILIIGTTLIAAAIYIFIPLGSSTSIIVPFECPLGIGVADNYDSEIFTTAYEQATKPIAITNNLTHFLETFRTEVFDNWGHSYEQVKAGMYHWKSNMFAPEINEGDSIYESACGIGLNIFMTLEILKEVKNIDTLYVYGNEYLKVSADRANLLFDHVAPNNAKKGKICVGDSTHLFFVPSNAFDLVYTGYIFPIIDPLHFNLTSEANDKKYAELCEAEDWQSKKLSEMAQGIQNDFYGKWVAEMVRIAKPGKAIIVEQVSLPLCNAYFDWGGVHPHWWKPAIDSYGWDVDPTSLTMENDTIFKQRYHVFLRKNRD